MKILHCADLHIREKDVEEIDGCLSMIVRTARDERVDLAVIAGDIFDSRDIKLDSRSALMAIAFVSALADICPVAIVLGTPSHDGKAPEILRFARGIFPIRVAAAPEQVYLYEGAFRDGDMQDGRPQAALTLIPQPTKQFFPTASDIRTGDQEIGQAMSGLFAGFGAQAQEVAYKAPHVLVYHGGISGAKLSTGQTLTGQDIEVSVDQLNLSGADLNLCGHIHMAQQIVDRTFYSGGIYRTNWGEMEPKGFWIHETGSVTPARFIETPCKKVARYSFDYTDPGSLKSLDSDAETIAGTHVRIDARVWQDEVEKFDFDAMKAGLLRWGAESVDIRIIRIPRENVRAEAVLKTDRLRDKIQKMAELREEEVSWSTLMKAESLEERKPNELIEAIGRAA
jgi:DNA repair exonuclease SbcCD nuclease subunit